MTAEQYFSLGLKWLKEQKVINTTEELQTLKNIINTADKAYYVEDNPLFADGEYDALFKILKSCETKNPNWIDANSPTQRIAKGLNDGFEKINHLVPMLSLENSYNSEDLIDWDEKIKSKLSQYEFCVEPKYDGASISLLYENGNLFSAATRGDGLIGDNITANAKQIYSIPLFFSTDISQIEIRGEVVLSKQKFKDQNEQLIQKGAAPMVNPRNAASGSLRMKNPKEVAKRKLDAFLYHISYIDSEFKLPFETHYESILWLKNQGFQTPLEFMKVCKNIEEVINYLQEFEYKREHLPFEIDGMVVKINNFIHQETLGMTTHHPRWAMAYKFKPKQATSTLEAIEYQVGRTGIITPVAKITPVFVGGVTISSISLFNEDVIREKQLMLGDQIVVERAGDVIPYIVKSNKTLRTGRELEIHFPENCPSCQQKLYKEKDEAAWRCVYEFCSAQIEEKIIHFVSKDAMDIKNLGENNIRRFIQLGLIKSYTDIYSLDFQNIINLDGFKEKSVEKLQAAIEESKKQPLHRLIFALGIRNIGTNMAKTLARHIDKNIYDIQNWSQEFMLTIDDVGDKVAHSLFQFFNDEKNIKLLNKLELIGVNISKSTTKNSTIIGGLTDKTFLFTGTLSMKRKDGEELVEGLGAKLLSSVSSKLNYLIVGENAGSKLDKAKKLGTITILDEEQFIELINKIQS